MDTSALLKILGLGVIGLGFLLALLAYQLLRQEQAKAQTNPDVLRSIYFFMGFSVILCVIGIVSQYLDQRRTISELNKLVTSHEGLTKVNGKITAPTPGSPVGTTFDCAGTVSNLEAGVHIWLAVEVKGSLWPKEADLTVG